jgi:hypothetical protein
MRDENESQLRGMKISKDFFWKSSVLAYTAPLLSEFLLMGYDAGIMPYWTTYVCHTHTITTVVYITKCPVTPPCPYGCKRVWDKPFAEYKYWAIQKSYLVLRKTLITVLGDKL